MLRKIKIFTDGGARGNPGPAAAGVIIYDENNKLIAKEKRYLGVATNNQAEYHALILGLERAKHLGAIEVDCFLDSELVVKQMNRQYRVKDKDLAPLFVKVWNLSQGFKKISFTHIQREKNVFADSLVNQSLDENGK